MRSESGVVGAVLGFALLVAVCVALSTTVGREPLADCVVVEKGRSDSWVQLVPVGETTVPVVHQETWWLVVRGRTPRGTQARRRIAVTLSEWDSVAEGDRWPDVP